MHENNLNVIIELGRPTTTIAVGDPLDFKLETQEGKNLLQVKISLFYLRDFYVWGLVIRSLLTKN